ncbi:hypothetical protein [Microbulbifer aggregans]|nr:hypothetical protein [Microbulbifer aggregans]
MMKLVWAILIVLAILMFGRFMVDTVKTGDEQREVPEAPATQEP